ncbi:MAG: PA14 domain-containing protein [Halobacteriota archaeon]|nr:PA14 domain-containing protein [Halobacteriota archaeon]
MVLNILLVSLMAIPVVLAEPSLLDQGPPDGTKVHKNESITLWAEWNQSANAELRTNGTGSWEIFGTTSGVNTTFTLAPDDIYNMGPGMIGWNITADSIPSPIMTFDLNSLAEVNWASPPESTNFIIGDILLLEARVTEVTTGISGSYFDNTNFTNLKFSRRDPEIDFTSSGEWNLSGISGNFSASWAGKLYVENTEEITFYTSSTDGSMLWIDEDLVISNWNDTLTQKSAVRNLAYGFHDILVLYYFNGTGTPFMQLEWDSASIGGIEMIPTKNLYHKFYAPIEDYPVDFYCRNSTMEQYVGTNLTNVSGYATLNWDTSTFGLTEGTYYLKCNITDNAVLSCNVTDENESSINVYLVDEVVNATLRGRRWYSAGLLAVPQGAANWADVKLTSGRTLVDPALPNVYNLSMNVDINGMDYDTVGKQLGPFFLTYNIKGLRIVDLPALIKALADYIIPFWGGSGQHPFLYITLGIWIDDNVLAGGLAVTHLPELIIPLYGIEGLTFWAGSSATEEEPFLQWLSNIGIANEMANFEETYPPSLIVEYCTQLIMVITDLIHALRVDLLADIITIILMVLDLIDHDILKPVNSMIIDPIVGVIVANLVTMIVEAIKYIVIDFVDLSEIALSDPNSRADLLNLMNVTAERLPDIIGDVSGTTGLTYILNNTLRVPGPVMQSLADEILLLIDWLFDWLPEIIEIIESIP